MIYNTNTVINICNININIYNITDVNSIKTKEREIQEKYDLLDRNIKTNTIEKNEAGKYVNDIALSLKYLFEQNFKYYNPLSQNDNYLRDTLKKFLEVALKLLKQFKKYLDEDKISKEVFDIFKNEVLYMIDTAGNARDEDSKTRIFTNLIEFEVLQIYNLEPKNYCQSRQSYFQKEFLEQYHKENYMEIFKTSHNKYFDFNPELYYTYFDSIGKFYKIFNEDIEIVFEEIIKLK